MTVEGPGLDGSVLWRAADTHRRPVAVSVPGQGERGGAGAPASESQPACRPVLPGPGSAGLSVCAVASIGLHTSKLFGKLRKC